MIILEVLDESCKCEVGIIYVGLDLPLEVLLLQWSYKLLLQDIFRIYYLSLLVHLGCMKLDVPWNFSCICIGWHWSCLWGADRALKILPSYSGVCGRLCCRPEETMLPPSQFWLDGWRVCLNFLMDFADNFVVEDPLTFCYFLEGEFSANIFRFGSHSWTFFFTDFGVLELPLLFLFSWVWRACII